MNISFELDRDSAQPVYMQLAAAICQAIDCGRIGTGTPLPSTRDLAASLSLSRDTVVNTYKELKRLAYVSSDATKGTYVLRGEDRSADPSTDLFDVSLDTNKLSNFGRLIVEQTFKHPSSPNFAALNYGAVPRSALPVRRWRTVMQQMCEPENFRKLEYAPHILGRTELRKALAAYLLRTKGLECDWRQVAVFSISSGLISVLCKVLLELGSVVAVEEPGYGAIKNLAKSQGMTILPVAVDAQGLRVDLLKNYPGKIKLVYITANHHDPSGVILSLARRQELLSWAQANDVWIVEDDYDGHFYYGADPPQTLWSLAPEANVFYGASFWQILYPLTTVGYAVVPKAMVPVIAAAKELQTEGISDFIRQLILASMLDDGHLEKHLRKVGKTFAKRRIALIYELKRQLGKQIQISNDSAGNYFVVHMHQWSKELIESAALNANLPLVSTETYYMGQAKAGEYLINFALMPEQEIGERVSAFVSLLK